MLYLIQQKEKERVNMQVNTITNETMHEIIQALLGKCPTPASIAPEQTAPTTQPPKYRPTVKLKTELSRKTMSISYSDICFVSTSAKAIRLPYTGELPDDLLAQIYTAARSEERRVGKECRL